MSDELAPYVIEQLAGSKRSESIGAGSYGVVREVRVNGLPCIAKKLHDVLTNEQRVSQEGRRAISERFRNECILLSRLRHPNIVQFLGVHYGRDRYDLTLVMEQMHMDLETALEEFPNMSLPIKIRILLDASYGLLHLHCQTPSIVHRDFTAANILLSADMRAKVADLGVSKILDMSPQQFSKHTKCPGALGYMAPEALQQKPVYDVKLDVFSFGHLTLYTVNQQYPEVHELGPEGAKAVRKGQAQLAKRKIAIDMMGEGHCLHWLVTSCLEDNPKKRPTTSQVNSTLQDLSAQHQASDPDSHSMCSASCQQQKHQLQAEIGQWRETKETLEREVELLRGQISALRDEIQQEARERRAVENAEIGRLNKRLIDLEIENECLIADEVRARQWLEDEYRRMADEHTAMSREIKSLQDEMAQTSSCVAKHESSRLKQEESDKHLMKSKEIQPYSIHGRASQEFYHQFSWTNIPPIRSEAVDWITNISELSESGDFGAVMACKAVWMTDAGYEEVAAKLLKPGSLATDMAQLLQEAAILSETCHPNIVKMHGMIIEDKLVMMVLELFPKGDLLAHLNSLRLRSTDEVDKDLPRKLLCYCRQIATGLSYLSAKNIIHRSIAARNIMVSQDGNICKIGNFGMSQYLGSDDSYISQGGKISVKWTAPEAMYFKVYSAASDVWSFGVVMYEIWSLGHKPYEGYSKEECLRMLDNGIRLPPPPGCPRPMYNLMIKCWHIKASKRPAIAAIVCALSSSDSRLLSWKEDGQTVRTDASSLGLDLDAGSQLYRDLQITYH